MDDREFEELTKAMADGQSRRRIVKIFGAGVLSGVAGWFGSRGDTDAKRKRKHKHKVSAQGVVTTTTTTKAPPTTTTTKAPPTTTTTKAPPTTTKPPFCGHSTGPNGGCMGSCTAAGFTGRQCGPICGTGQFTGACPVGQGGDNPCCNSGFCNPSNFVAGSNGNPVYVGPTSGCS